MEDFQKQEHDSYALLQISRVTNIGGTDLFGSSIKHLNTIRLRICKGIVERNLNKDWYNGGKEYIEVEMSYSQFAEVITNLNQGVGVPVTLRYLNGEQIEECPFTNKRQEFENEFKEKMDELNNKLKRLTENTEEILNNKEAPTKADKKTILTELQMLKQEIESNIPYVASSFNEQMDKTVMEAKGEVEGFVMHKIISAGLKGL